MENVVGRALRFYTASFYQRSTLDFPKRCASKDVFFLHRYMLWLPNGDEGKEIWKNLLGIQSLAMERMVTRTPHTVLRLPKQGESKTQNSNHIPSKSNRTNEYPSRKSITCRFGFFLIVGLKNRKQFGMVFGLSNDFYVLIFRKSSKLMVSSEETEALLDSWVHINRQ